MTERKSKKVDSHVSEIKKLIIATIFVGAISLAFARDWAAQEADKFIDEFYSSMNSTNSSSLLNLQYIEPFNNDSSYLSYPEWNNMEDTFEEEPEQIHFNPHTRNTTVHIHHNQTQNTTMYNHRNYTGNHPIRGGANEHSGHHHRHHDSPLAVPIKSRKSPAPVDPGMHDVQDFLANTDLDQAKDIANYYIRFGINAGAVWCMFIIGLIQYFYLSALKKMGKSQKQLEEVFMGQEIVAAPTAAPAI